MDALHFIRKGVVIPRGVNGTIDDTQSTSPGAVFVNGKIYFYYMGYDGSKFGLCLAISGDGIHFIKKGGIMARGAPGTTDDTYQNDPYVLFFNNKFYLYHSIHDGSNQRGGLSISEDGIHFIKKGVILNVGDLGAFDDIHISIGGVIHFNNRVYLYYGGYNGALETMGLAISGDGIHFVKKGVIMPRGANESVDSDIGWGNYGIIVLNNKIYLFYGARIAGVPKGIALAVSDDGIHFNKKGLVLGDGGAGKWDAENAPFHPCAVAINNKIYLYYCGASVVIGLAVSKSA